MTTEVLVLSGQSLDIAQVVRVARERVPVVLSAAARERILASRAVVERLAQEGKPIYGVTTGLGEKAGVRLEPTELEAFQELVVLSRSVAVGPCLPTEVVRAMLVVRVNGLAVGGAGTSLEVVEAMLAMLNAGVHPRVPAIGSIGASDLAPLAHLALPLIGHGEAEFRGEQFSGAEALRRAGLSPVRLGIKEGLTLCSANAVSLGQGALVLADALGLWQAATIAAALSFEGFRANLTPFDPRVQAARPAPGQATAAARLCKLLAGSDLWQAGAARRLQDPLSFRCLSQVHGACLASLELAQHTLESELNGASDNPLVLPEAGLILSNGNFDIPAVALQLEAVGLSLSMLANLTVERVKRLMSPVFSGLPLSLTPLGGNRTGLATLQKTLTALAAELRHLAAPICLSAMPVSDDVEDHATLAPLVTRKTAEILMRLRYIVAIELLVAAQAIDLRGPLQLGHGVGAAFKAIRAEVPPLAEDRILSSDVERLHNLIADGTLLRQVAAAEQTETATETEESFVLASPG
ncbi:histidine ammonia-lyase [Leptolyngbya sp. FACHB-261]|uniref:HAL/PAL/TAL family ammonia-lyase n=1 Tax=Leptolyngbya sp. FACHB-261 TaxID=2692806 RepID=UPI001689724D|nr:histidine ammonia-lyase [Leptolyngbya sp. FACHB-261]MBD2104846.1 histidine ammonia-lyase [Leptolyngbya sp. FACHB-261]